MQIRKGEKNDLPRVLELIQELADYEKASDEVAMTTKMLEEDGFGSNPVYGLIVVENDVSEVVGMALFYYRYSTWKGKTLHLEDMVVTPKERGKNYGKALFESVIKRANSENCMRMSWQVLDWNEPAINFYKKYGAQFDGEWINCDLFKDQLHQLN